MLLTSITFVTIKLRVEAKFGSNNFWFLMFEIGLISTGPLFTIFVIIMVVAI